MVLIMSTEYDYSTIEITKWLRHYDMPFIRLDGEQKFKIKKISIGIDNDFIIYDDLGRYIAISEIKSIWYRRGNLNVLYPVDFKIASDIEKSITEHLIDELKILKDYFYFLMNQIPHLGSFKTRGMNKLAVLNQAQNLGLKIPKTYVCDSLDNFDTCPNMITKCISEPFMPNTPFGEYMTYTEDIINKDSLQSRFFPSLFQEKYEKEADLRIFYLNGFFYSMAIRSQSHNQTATDFRKYLNDNPNRKFPFNIPINLQKKLKKLMKMLSLETGSIDMIFTKKGEYIFLEVNPIGQFGMTSYPCNYNLEKLLAVHLKKIANYGETNS